MDSKSYEHLVKKSFPKASLNHCSHIDVGQHTHVIITKSKDRVFKIPRTLKAPSVYELEKNALQYIDEHISTHIPKIKQILPNKESPSGVIIEMEHAEGKELTLASLKKFSEQELEQLGKDIGNTLIELHTMPLSVDIDRRQIPRTGIIKESEKLTQLSFWDELTKKEKEYLQSIYAHGEQYFIDDFHNTPIHNDFGMNHVFTKQHSLSSIIDWGCIVVGDPARDFRWAIGPRSLHKQVFDNALKTYVEKSTGADKHFIGRAIYYNESKALRTLERAYTAQNIDVFHKAKEFLKTCMKESSYLRELPKKYSAKKQ